MSRMKAKKTSQTTDNIFGSQVFAEATAITDQPPAKESTSASTPANGLEGPATCEVVLDIASAQRIAGWAWCSDRPQERLAIKIFFDETEVAAVNADRYRKDLKAAKKGDGRH